MPRSAAAALLIARLAVRLARAETPPA